MKEAMNLARCCSAGIAHDCHAGDGCRIVERIKTVNTTPQQRTWVGLDSTKMLELWRSSIGDSSGGIERYSRAIESYLKEKNT
jgi:hypothetical protein